MRDSGGGKEYSFSSPLKSWLIPSLEITKMRRSKNLHFVKSNIALSFLPGTNQIFFRVT